MKPVFNMTGDAELTRMMDALAKISSHYVSADMHGKERADGKNNAEIAGYLREQGRNFFETQSTADAAAKAFAAQLEIAAARAKTAKTDGQRANLAAQVWIAAMEAALERAAKNIDEGAFEGGGSASLSEIYEPQKYRDHGFTYPIGKATGELLNNLSSHAGNIKLKRS